MDNKTPREDYTEHTYLRDWWEIVKENFQRIFSYVDEVREYADNVWNSASSGINEAQTSIDAHKKDSSNPHNVNAEQIQTISGKNVNDELYEVKEGLNSHKNNTGNPHNVTADLIALPEGIGLNTDNVMAEFVNINEKLSSKVNLDTDNIFTGVNTFNGSTEIFTENVSLNADGNLSINGELTVQDRDILNELSNVESELSGHLTATEGNLRHNAEQIVTNSGNSVQAELDNKAGQGDVMYLQNDINTINEDAGRLQDRVTAVEEEVLNVKNEVSNIETDALVLESEKATSLVLTDAKEAPLVDYKIYGNSTQTYETDNPPSPENPIDIVSVGDLVTNENATEEEIANGKVGMYKIPVTVSGDGVEDATYYIYLDAPLRKVTATFSGEDDICDYIDFERQVVVRNVGEYTIKSTDSLLFWNQWTDGGSGRRIMLNASPTKKVGNGVTTLGCFNIGTVSQTLKYQSKSNILSTYSEGSSVYWHLDYTVLGLDGTEDKDTANAALIDWVANFDGRIYFTYVLKTPTEKTFAELGLPDPPEIITNYPLTSLVCDGEMEVTYKADTTNAYNNLKSELDTLKQAIISLGGTV